MVEFLTNYLIPVLLMTGVGIAILLWVLTKYFHTTKLTTANAVGVGCVFTGLALVMAGVLPLAGLQRYDEASYFYAFSGALFCFTVFACFGLCFRDAGPDKQRSRLCEVLLYISDYATNGI